MNWRVLNFQVGGPAWNMAVDEAIFISYLEGKSPPTLRFYGWSPPTVSIGYFQNIEREINIERLNLKGYGLVRRNTGGRAVLHDRELTYSIVAGTKEGLPDNLMESYLYISKAFAYAFQDLGVKAEINQGADKYATSGACFESPSWYEITVNGRKLAGSAQLRQKTAFLQHGSILLSFSAADLGAVLNIPTESLGTFVEMLQGKIVSLADLGVGLGPSELALKITESFNTLYGIIFEPGKLSAFETELARLLAINKYATEEWNYQRGNTRDQKRVIRMQAGDGCHEILRG